ncbi:MAG: lipoprotein N-acyltransferase Lnb domain-containing protein [bacterium]
MMKKLLVLGLIGLMSLMGRIEAQTLPLSETAVASVLTCGPGDDFYTTFGHSAIRICDTAQRIDLVYNYGTFDFNTPHFYWKFMRGQLDYMLGRSSFRDFMVEYMHEGREVREQRLTMEPQQVSNLFVLLETNYLPEYRHYRYDFFRDNCATRIRDMVYSAWGGDTLLTRHTEPMSYRQLVTEPLRGTLEWWRLGIDLLFGLPADHVCDANERMFWPLELEAELAACCPDGVWTAPYIVEPSKQLIPERRSPLSRSFPPVVVFAMLFAVVAVLTWRCRWPRWADRLLFVLAGVVGLFLLFMWFGTDHYCTEWNLNILWTSPLLILIGIRLDCSPKWALWLQEACFLAAAVWVLWCGLSPALLPLILTLALRVGIGLKGI